MGSGPSFPVVRLARERIVVVTGATSGLGYEIAKWTAMMGATVILACRSEQKTRKTIETMNAEFRSEKAQGTVGITEEDTLALEYMKLDLNSFNSVQEFVEEYKRSGRKLHVLFCNAGIGLGPYVSTEDGYEQMLQVNYLGHFLLTARLIHLMKQSGPDCRLILMSSIAHKSANFNIKTINYAGDPSDFPKLDYYGRSKLYQIMQMFSMARRFINSNITINSLHPGVVDTGFGSEATEWYFRFGLWCGRNCGISKSADDAAKCSINCAVNPNLEGVSGVYFDNFKRPAPSADARNKEYQELLWKQTLDYLQPHLNAEEISAMEGH